MSYIYVYFTESRPYEFKYGIFNNDRYERIFEGQTHFSHKIKLKYLYKVEENNNYFNY